MTNYHLRFMDGRPDRRAELPDGRAASAEGRRGAPLGLLGDIVLCPSVPAKQAAETAVGPTRRPSTCWCTAFFTCSFDHAEPEERR